MSDNTIKHINFSYQYVPPLIRQQYQNFENLNMNPCDLGSLRGILNLDILDKKSQITNHMSDVNFYYDNDYYKKYIKYKTKYLELKQSYG